MMNMQFFGEGWINLIFILMFFVMMFFGQRIMVTQILYKLDQKAREYELIAVKSKKMFLSKLPNRSSKTVKESLNRFADFVLIEPVNLDPNGIVRKLEHIVDASDERFKHFIDNIAPHKDAEEKANLAMGIKGVIGVNQVAKVVRHFVEVVRKTKNIQIAMLLQMQLPFIEKIIKSQYKGTESMLKGEPIGDGMGPYMAASLLDKEGEEIERDTIVGERKYRGRTLYVMKATGPGGRLGKLGRATEKLIKKNKLNKIITIDVGAKMEGEKSGTVAEGVGVAIGGIGIDKSQIEDIAVKHGIPLDTIVIKVSMEEAIEPLRQVILDAEEEVIERLNDAIDRSPKNAKILVIGVGNTTGVGNKRSDLAATRDTVKRIEQKIKRKEREREENKGFWKNLFKKPAKDEEEDDW